MVERWILALNGIYCVSLFFAFYAINFKKKALVFCCSCLLHAWNLEQIKLSKEKKKLKSCFLYSLFFPGAVLIDQYCNPLSDICLKSVQAQVDDITDKVRKVLRTKNPRHPSLASKAGTVQKYMFYCRAFLQVSIQADKVKQLLNYRGLKSSPGKRILAFA